MRSRCLPPLSILLLVLATSACSTLSVEEREMRARLTTMFETVYTEVAETHVEEVDLERFTLNGLEGLRVVDPTLSIVSDEEASSITLKAGDTEEIIAASLPSSGADTETWSRFARSMVLRARDADLLIAGADEEELYDVFFTTSMRDLDRASRYATPEDEAASKANREGYGGIGVRITSAPKGARIDVVDPSTPAMAAGLQVGDTLTHVDGQSLETLSKSEISKRLRGAVDTAVNLTLVRDGVPNPMEVRVGRARVVPNTVFWERRADHAVIRITSFNQRTSKRIAEAVSQARSEIGPSLNGLVLDLRGNLGGLLDQAVDSADLFLEEGLISKADGRHPDSHQRFDAEPGDIAKGLPVVVLVDGSTASAAEILAAALQDHGRAPVIGMSTFGKGTIQTILTLPNRGALYITWARFLAPSGYALKTHGVLPTICTSGTSDAIKTLEDALTAGPDSARELLELRRSLDPNEEGSRETLQGLCPWRPHASGDIDLSIAELLLDSPTMQRRAVLFSRVTDGL